MKERFIRHFPLAEKLGFIREIFARKTVHLLLQKCNNFHFYTNQSIILDQ